jgi:hypothetical protein
MAKTVAVKKAVRPAPHIAPERGQKSDDPTVRTYRSLTRLLVADDTEAGSHYRHYGDFVPEAGKWPNIGVYLKGQQVEICYVNQSEIDMWREEYAERIAAEDGEKEEQSALAKEEAELRARLAQIQKEKMSEKDALVRDDFAPGKTEVQKIDFGGVKMGDGGAPHPVSIPDTTREVPQQKNVAENRTRPTTVRRKKG